MLLYQILACTLMEKYEKVIKSNRFKISAPTWDKKFNLLDGSCSLRDIQYYFECIL